MRKRVSRYCHAAGIIAVLGGLMSPAIALADDARTPEQWAELREENRQKLREIGVALQNYHDVYKRFPGRAIGKAQQPQLSWRVGLLPFLERHDLYQKIRFDEPWDSEHNRQFIDDMPAAFKAPSSGAEAGRTVYLGVNGPGMFLDQKPTPIRSIIDGTSKTICIVEVDDAQAVIWTRPDDWQVDPEHLKVGFRGQFPDGIHVGVCDSSVRFLRYDIKEDLLRALLTIGGREPVAFPD